MKNNYKLHRFWYLYIVLLLCIPIGYVQAQNNIRISGQVRDAHGALPGVMIQVKNSIHGTLTDEKGNYVIRVKPNDVLVFSFMGYHSQEIPIKNESVLNVELVQDTEQLAEITINAGYYTVKDRERTGSIARVTAKDIENKGSNNILDALQGQAAGVQIIQKTGLAGGGFEIQIRGQNSLRKEGNSPLYIIDGMPISNGKIRDDSFNSTMPFNIYNPLSNLNPNDIQSIEILKDADATAIYGSRGANGVVLITTKKAKQGGTQFHINSFTGIGKITKKVPLMKTEQFLEMVREGFANDGISDYPSHAHWINGNWDASRYTDWQEKLIGNTMQFHHLDFGIRGGNAQTMFNVSTSSHEQGTVFIGNQKQQSLALQAGLQHHSIDDKFHLGLSIGYNELKNNLPGKDFTLQAISLTPNAPELYNSDGSLNWENSTWTNPLQSLEQKYKAKNSFLSTSAFIHYKPVKDLEFKIQIGYSENGIDQIQLTPSTYYNPAYSLNSESSSIIDNKGNNTSWNIEPQLNWFKEWGKHQISALVGLTFLSQESNRLGLMGYGFSSNNLIQNAKAASHISILDADKTEYKYHAVFSRLNYQYENKYIFNITGRRDGSSRFGDNNRFANFGALGTAWIFSNEKWLAHSTWLSFGKLRGSYGTTGSDQIGDYQFLNTYSTTGIGYDGVIGLSPDRLYNPNFSWEKTNKMEVSIELGFFNNRINTTASWYDNRSSSQLVGTPLPGTTGFSSIQANLNATVQNSGWEFTLDSKNIASNHWNWSTSFNLSIPKNKLLSFPDLEGSTYANEYEVGQSLYIQKLYHFLGVNAQTGLYEFEDYEQDGITTDDKRTFLNPNPKWYGGLQNSLSYKNWSLDMTFYFVKQLGRNYRSRGLPGTGNNLIMIQDRWQEVGDNANTQRYTSGSNTKVTKAQNYMASSDGAYTDASFIRLKNISLSYTLESVFKTKAQCKFYFNAENIFTITSYKEADPETQLFGYLPPLRQFTFGTQINF